jgi:hypothetical protein
MTSSPLTAKTAVWLVLAMLSAASMGYYVADIWSANQPPGFSDLYAPWWAAHEVLLHGRNPYSPAVAHEIQTVIYGAPVAPSPDDPYGLGGGFAYPPYAVLLLWPTVYSSFPTAQKIFLLASVLLTLLSLALWLRALRVRLSPVHWIVAALFLLGSFPALQALKLQNLSLLAAGLLAITIYFLAESQLVLGGIFLALSTFKPQFTVGLLPWLLLWTVADWRRRRALALSFLVTMLLLVAVGESLVQGWVTRFLRVVIAYRHYTYGHSLLDVWFTPTFGPLAAGVILLGVLVLCWPHRSEAAGSARFLLATSLVLAATVVVIPTLAPHAQLLLLPGFLCLLPGVYSLSGFARILRAAAWMLLTWPWMAAFGLLLGALWLPVSRLQRFWQVLLYTSPVLPLAVVLGLGFLAHAGSAQLNPHPQGDSALGLDSTSTRNQGS